MKRIPASTKQLKTAFKKHYFVYKNICDNTNFEPITKRLILFYSVESGLKYFLLNKIGKNTTDAFRDHPEYGFLIDHGHDLKKMIEIAQIGNTINFQLKHTFSLRGGKIEPEQFHQIWRYGIEVKNSEDEAKSEDVLKNVANWLEQRI